MKKSVLTLSLIALFAVSANAQTKAKTTSKQEPTSATIVNDDGTTSPASTEKKQEAAPEKKQDAPVKKSGTRMAINEKGSATGPKKSSRSENKKEETNTGQPAGTGKKD